jgi:uncharacterized DUF497 family protein
LGSTVSAILLLNVGEMTMDFDNNKLNKQTVAHNISAAAGQVRQALAEMRKSETWKQIVEPRDAVFARFQPIFDLAHLPRLTAEEFKPFFYFTAIP